MNERRYSALVSLLGLAVACTAVAGLRWLWGVAVPDEPAPLWAVCCQMVGMDLTNGATPIVATVAQSALFALALYGLGSLSVRIWKTRHFLATLRVAAVTAPPERLIRAARELGLVRQVMVIATPHPLAFCHGLLRPRICVSTGLVEALADAELRAVLLHEDHHRRRFDPLRGLVAEVLGATFSFLPIARELRDLILTHAELAADRYAALHAGKPSLAGALHKILTHPLALRLPAAVGVSGLSATETRIAHLLGDRNADLRLSAYSLLSSSAILVAVCMIAQSPAF